ncbi:type III secretion system translocon subunit SctE [Candidatus Sororendozoicomonas aggregata]|uniref:type III secretion system translocon subunit SctE n=1 Tax=Candidatus Sororendozoicomonas aggregata TaxID=3073239 RepID=UPI002ED195F9
MSTIGPSGNNSPVTGTEQTRLQPATFSDESVKRGYDTQITQSRHDEVSDAKTQKQHRLETPSLSKGKIDTLKTLREMSAENGAVSAEDVANANQELSPAAKEIKENSKKAALIRGYETITSGKVDAEKLDQLTKIANEAKTPLPADKVATWDDVWQSAENRQNGQLQGADGKPLAPLEPNELKQLEALQANHDFAFQENGALETIIRAGAIVDGPPELIKEIQADVQKLAGAMALGNELWDTDMLATMLSSIQEKMQDNRLKYDQETIKIGLEEKKILSEKNISKIRDRIEEENKNKVASDIQKAFGWVALAFGYIAAGAMIATGVGAVAGTLLIASLAIATVMMVDQEMGGELIMKPMAESIQDTFGCSEEDAGYAAMGIMAGIMVVLAVASMGAGFSNLGSVGGTMGGVVTSKVGVKVAQTLSIVGNVGEGAATVASGAGTVAAGVSAKEAAEIRADSKELQAQMLRLQQMIDEATESLEQALEDLQAGHSRIASIMSDNDDTKKQLGKALKG